MFEAVYQQSFPQGSPREFTLLYCLIPGIRTCPQGSPAEFSVWYCFILQSVPHGSPAEFTVWYCFIEGI